MSMATSHTTNTSSDIPIEQVPVTSPPGLAAQDKVLVQELAPISTRQSRIGSQADARELGIRQTVSNQAVVILLPQMTRDLKIPPNRQQWIVSTFALTSGSFLLLFGKLGDVYGKRAFFILGCFWVTVTALATAFSPIELVTYVMRALHGLGSAATIPSAIGIIGYTIPPGRVKTYSFAFYSGGAPAGQVLGNLLGGLISEYTSWKVVFFAIAGVSFIVGIIAIFVIPKEPASKAPSDDQPRASGVDWTGAFLFTSGTLLLLIALSQGVSQGWRTPFVIAVLIVSVILLAVFIYWQHYLETKSLREPLMHVSTFKTARFSFAMVIIFFFSGGFTNYLVYSTYFYQDYQLLSPIQTTLRFIPLGIVGMASTVASGYLLSRVRGNFILIFGLVLASLSNLLFAVPIPPSTSYFAYGFLAMCFAAVGADTIYPCIGLFTTQALPRKDQGVAGAMFQTVASMGRAMFLPVTAAVQYSTQNKLTVNGHGETYALLEGLRAAEWLCFALMAVSLLVTILGLRDIGRIGQLKKLGQVQSGSAEIDTEK
ncbi:MFS multidrug transporter-like protein [Venustampulla echinocandica]|uniref:MFS multidrug transporter-like protein n=1 Tax=Venustampulla echinocandica TaxID=2656787 RepID=A0A370T8N8_9HELO|nr:MFS multidrug transporter-like protein [Venustampulla echinocandica]RDL29788.1 MFS multidrug transporter-like protein [Venustampulla echinocandica]